MLKTRLMMLSGVTEGREDIGMKETGDTSYILPNVRFIFNFDCIVSKICFKTQTRKKSIQNLFGGQNHQKNNSLLYRKSKVKMDCDSNDTHDD